MSLGNFALQSRIYSTLNGDSNLTSTLGAGVFDEVPQNQAYPFVKIGEFSSVDYGTKDVDGNEATVQIDIYSRYRGSKQVHDIMDRIHTLLHNASLTVSGYNLINIRFEFSDIVRDADGITRQGVMRFRAAILGTS
tara:strand:- start:2626 stop:3033 length:408 start_codon:yes stop_codon:yes gene_type:complete